jgi:hypothetical protein
MLIAKKKTTFSEKWLSQCHFIHLIFYTYWPDFETRTLRSETGEWISEPRTDRYSYLRDLLLVLLSWRSSPTLVVASALLNSVAQTQWHTITGRTSLYKGSARPTRLYLKTPNIKKKKISMPPVGSFYFIFLCLYFIRTCFFVFIVLHFAFIYNTQHKHSWPRRDSNPKPSNRSDADSRHWRLGHWDRQFIWHLLYIHL